MKPERSHLELLTLLVTIYSIVTLICELEFVHSEVVTAYFLWSERLVVSFFTVEYIVRWIASRSWWYPLRALAIIDLLAITPFFFGFLIDLRSLRLLRAVRVVRVLRLYRYTTAFDSIARAFTRVSYEIGVVGFALLTLAGVSSVVLYELENEAQPESFARLSDAGWYTITTLTTVGYGDKVPVTAGGKAAAAVLMLFGLALFGTFMSLIGSAFLEELRRRPRPEDRAELDPGQVLKALDSHAFAGEAGHREMARLLAVACRRLEQGQ